MALSLVAMAATLFWQAWSQFARVSLMLEQSSFGQDSAIVRIELARRILGASVPEPADRPHAFKGSARDIAGMTAAPPGDLGMAPFAMTLRHDAAADVTVLSFAPAADIDAGGLALLTWPGNVGRFLFLTEEASGLAWADAWPPDPGAGRAADVALPLAIAIESGLEQAPLIVAALQLGPRTLPDRRLLGEF